MALAMAAAAYLAVSTVWAGGAVVILVTAVAGHRVQIDSSGDLAIIDHPTGAAALWGAITAVWFVVLVVCLVAAVVQQAAGYRRASGVRRLQLKWLASGAAVAVICGVFGTVPNNAPGVWQVVSDVLVAGIAALPASMGVAILRYRLYDIDRLISRTVSYTLLTGLLVGVYAAGAAGHPGVPVPHSGGGGRRHAGGGGAVQPGAAAGAAGRGPAVQPGPV